MMTKTRQRIRPRILTWALFASVFGAAVQAQPTERISVGQNGVEGNGLATRDMAFSSDGRFVMFGSDASNLVPGDDNGYADVFVRDRLNGTTTLVSLDPNGQQWPHDSRAIFISSDGRFVLYFQGGHLYRHDLAMGQTEMASVGSQGQAVTSYDGSMSADGNRVAFASTDLNVALGDANTLSDVFLYDFTTQTTELCSRTPIGVAGNDHSGSHPGGLAGNVAISPDGRFVAFGSAATDLIARDTNGYGDVFVFSVNSKRVRRVSEAQGGIELVGPSFVFNQSFSFDGRYLLIYCSARNILPIELDARTLFVIDRLTGAVDGVTYTTDGTPTDGRTYYGTISADGRIVAFASRASNLVPGDNNGAVDVFAHDRLTNTTRRMSLDFGGSEIPGRHLGWDNGIVSPDGREVAFTSGSGQIVLGDNNGVPDVFVRDRIEITFEGTPAPGNPVRYRMANALGEGGNVAAVLLSCSGTTGIPLPGGQTIELTADNCTALGLSALPFLRGVIDAQGNAVTPLTPWPNVAAGLLLHSAALTFDPAAGRIASVTGPIQFVTQ